MLASDLEGRNAVVIGGGSGIGRGIALALAAEGMRVVVGDIQGESAAAVAEEILTTGGAATHVSVDGRDRASLATLADRAVARYGAVHVLSTNVGVFANRPLDSAADEDWSWIIELNLMSAVRAVDVFLPYLRASGPPAAVVVTASMAALRCVPPARAGGVHLGLYTTTKHALLGFTETLRTELEPEGIGVSVLCPGQVHSNLMETSLRLAPGAGEQRTDVTTWAQRPEHAMSGEEVGQCVVRGITANRLHILTHPDARAGIEARHQALMADFEYFARS
ncbi:MAG TPA: SDR family NAD(P)-dependent oxidoreductase [Acidimicrobiales bacterium]|jgi:NAD(P)-dependent dehydrogenase (short-subunit alcohol dehydrogenase family)